MTTTTRSRGALRRIMLMLLFAILSPLAYGVALAQSATETEGEARAAEIEQLRQVIRDKQIQEQDPEQLVKAMRRLGELKAVEAIDDLIALLAFKHPKEMRTGGAYDGYIAKWMLAEIGEPALPALVRAIADNDIGSVEFKNARFAVLGGFRDGLPAASKYLREQSKEFPSAAAQARLWAAAQWIDDLHAKVNAEYEKQK